jgi:hypothetical protein
MEIEIDEDMLHTAFRENIRWHIKNVEKDLKLFGRKKKLEKYQLQDKEYFEKLLPALKVVGDYFGVKK